MTGTPAVGRWDFDDAARALCLAERRFVAAVYRPPRTTIVLGAGSDPSVELHLDAVAADRVPVLRRGGGGCSVVLDPGNVVLTIVAPSRMLPGIRSAFDRVSAFVIEGLAACGVAGVTQEGVSDLALGGRKIAGACLQRERDLAHYGVTILCDADVAAIARYLRHPPREPSYRAGRNHSEFVVRLVELNAAWTSGRLGTALDRWISQQDLAARLSNR